MKEKMIGVPKGIRTPASSVKGRCPRPLDDGDLRNKARKKLVARDGLEPSTPSLKVKCSTD